jgi:hypothetical protein
MNTDLLRKHIKEYVQHIQKDKLLHEQYTAARQERIDYYQSWTVERISSMSEEEFYDYICKLWVMLIWGNKKYVVDKLIADNGFKKVKDELAELVWGKPNVEDRWDHFRKEVKGVGMAPMMSEILCHTHPNDCMLWNRQAYVGLRFLGVTDLPHYDYQQTGKKYCELSGMAKEIAKEMRELGIPEANLLTVDYFIWHELQFEENLSQFHEKPKRLEIESEVEQVDAATSEFIHDEVKEKLRDIGLWLGFKSETEKKVAVGLKVDTVWEATIGNMGRVIYVFEVQTGGSIDSLIINLLKSLNNPVVQGIVAVSDALQLAKIKEHAAGVSGLHEKLKYWDYKEVLHVHESLESVNESINSLGLVPKGL